MTRTFPYMLVALALAACSSGRTEEDTDAGTSPTDGGATTIDGGATTPDAGHQQPACNAEDTLPCEGSSQGTCRPGTRYCQEDGHFGVCEGRLQPAPGVCDLLDCATGQLAAGCECKVGESRECYSANEEFLGKGPCRRGYKECVPSQAGSKWTECRNEVVPAASDDCTGRDLDCELGPPEAGCNCTGTATRPCGGVSGGTCALGTQACAGGTWGECQGAVQPKSGDCSQNSCLGGPNPGCECTIGETEACYTSIFGTEHVGTCHAGTRTCLDPGLWGPCAGQASPSPPCDRHFGPTCTGEFAPGCE